MIRAILLAAGKGTRMKSADPKVLHEVCGRPMLWFVVRALRGAGVDDIVVVTSPDLQKRIGDMGVAGIVQPEQRGTGDAVRVALAELPRNPMAASSSRMAICRSFPRQRSNRCESRWMNPRAKVRWPWRS